MTDEDDGDRRDHMNAQGCMIARCRRLRPDVVHALRSTGAPLVWSEWPKGWELPLWAKLICMCTSSSYQAALHLTRTRLYDSALRITALKMCVADENLALSWSVMLLLESTQTARRAVLDGLVDEVHAAVRDEVLHQRAPTTMAGAATDNRGEDCEDGSTDHGCVG